ncbi:MAG: DUF4982 domain-containing protein [Lachnospiraceae bacterium]|nr:DUF4982 domain-containing protein [Lachnospiraceae bacterium]
MKHGFNEGWEFAETPLDTPYLDVSEGEFSGVLLPHDFLITDAKALYRDATGWYRRRFTLQEFGIDPSHRVFIRFDGVYMDARFWLNGEPVGEWKYGYSPITLELTKGLCADGENELIVSVRHQSPNTRWYSGAGIFRDVTLIDKEQTLLLPDGVYFHADEKTENGDAFEIIIRSEIDEGAPVSAGKRAPASGDREIQVRHQLFDPDGREITLTPVFSATLKTDAPFIQHAGKDSLRSRLSRKGKTIRCMENRYVVSGIRRWDPEDPVRYTLRTELTRNGVMTDTEENRIGFRTAVFDPKKGLLVNGRHLKFNGVCEHHDLGVLGAAFDREAFRRKLHRLKEMGVNAIRLTHNMAAEGVLELADEEGFLLISEAFDMWERPKTAFDYARFFKKWHARDVEAWIRRDRNHPSVLLWSIGNEIYDTHADAHGAEITADLKALVERYDPFKNARATIGSNYMPWEGAQKCADILKIAGYNYAEKCYEQHHAAHPDWVIYGSETGSIVQSRGVYHFPLSVGSIAEEDGQCSSLGNSCTSWGAHSFEECAAIDRDLPYSLGQFLWSGFDYIGEPTPYHFKNSYFGQIDTAGFPKDAFYFWQSVWTDGQKSPMIHIIPGYWDFNPGQLIDVRVVSNLRRVALFLNGKSLGERILSHEPGSGYALFADFRVPYEAGELTAFGYEDEDSQTERVRETLHSFGDTAEIRVTPEPETEKLLASGSVPADALLFYEITAADADGCPVGNACDRVHVAVTGGRLLGLDSGDSTDFENYRSPTRRLFNGRLLAVVRADGGSPVQVTAIRDDHDIPVRHITIEAIRTDAADPRLFTGERRTQRARVRILPADATDREIKLSVVTDTGVTSPLATVDDIEPLPDGSRIVTMTAMGDGAFRLRATSKSNTELTRVISELEYRIEGVGTAYLNPYELISGSLYTSSIGEVGSGNEKGVTSARDGRTIITFEGLDFGTDFADAVTLPLFTLNDEAYSIRIWRGIPGDAGAKLLVDGIYQKPMIWNTYQEETWALTEPLTGIQTVSLEVQRKFHIKGLVFRRVPRAWARHSAVAADAIYGDQYRREEDAICGIGNNVSLVFRGMDFGEEEVRGIRITGRGRLANSIHVHFSGAAGEELQQLIEFPAESDFTEHIFALDELPGGGVRGAWDISLIFLPGSDMDLQSFQFEREP